MAMNLTIDAGNTRVKYALFDGERIVTQGVVESLDEVTIDRLKSDYPIHRTIVASTRGEVSETVDLLRRKVGHCLPFTWQTPIPLRNGYETPQTLGADRLAAAIGAAGLYPGRELLVVDLGTAITVDRVTAAGEFLGGNISPGMALRFRALSDHTAALPHCTATDDDRPWGTTTRTAIQQGVIRSIVHEIEGYIARMEAENDAPVIIFTGGDAIFFEKRIKNTIFAHCDLVFRGLNRILEYNAREESRS